MNPNPKTDHLRPPWTSETAPRRKNAGLSVNEWRNELSDWEPDEIENFLSSTKGPAAKRIAAQEVKQAMDGSLNAIAQLCDYSNHKPETKSDVTHTTVERVKRIIAPSRN